MATSVRNRLAALKRKNLDDPLDPLDDAEITALRDIALARFAGRHDEAEALFAAQSPLAQARIIAAARGLKGPPS